MTSYTPSNSLSPMMFRRAEQSGTRNERFRSRSMENILDPVVGDKPFHRAKTTLAKPEVHRDWSEIRLLKSISPVVTCLLPRVSMDFVCSALLAVGATPLITEDPDDLQKDLQNSKAVVVDVSAPKALLEKFVEEFEIGSFPLILIATQAGSNDRKRDLAQKIIEECAPTMISGRLGDIYAVAQAVLEKENGLCDDCNEDGDDDSDSSPERKTSVPKVVLDDEHIPQAVRRRLKMAKNKQKSRSPSQSPPLGSRSPISPRGSPSPSPCTSPRGIRKKIEEGPLHRVGTALPMVHMKGQFRDCTMGEVPVEQALEESQKLAAHTDAFVHLYETNVVTNGEVIAEITNNQVGMGNLHSILASSGAIAAAVLGCVEDKGDDLVLRHCSHALSLHYIAGEEGASQACSTQNGTVQPGSLRQFYLNALHYLDEHSLRMKARICAHTAGTTVCTHP